MWRYENAWDLQLWGFFLLKAPALMNSVSLMPSYKNYLKVRCLNLDTHSCVLASFSEEISSTGFAVNCICLL